MPRPSFVTILFIIVVGIALALGSAMFVAMRVLERPVAGDAVADLPWHCPAPNLSPGETVTFDLRRSGRIIVADVTLESQRAHAFIFDTGSKLTFVDQRLGAVFPDSLIVFDDVRYEFPDGTVHGVIAESALRMPLMQLSEARIEDSIVPVIDLQPLAPLAEETIYGVLGFQHFSGLPTRIDLKNGRFQVATKAARFGEANSARVPLRAVNGKAYVEILIAGHPVNCLIDTGATGSFMLPAAAFDALAQLYPDEVATDTAVSVGGKTIAIRRLSRSVPIVIGDHVLHGDLHESPHEFGIMGQQALELFIITLDPEAELAHFQLAADEP